MEFSGQYLTFLEYLDLGGTLEPTPFNLLEYEARRIIDIRTFNRLKELETIPEEVKLCEYKMINSINNYIATINSTAGTNGVSSENIDGYSVSYTNATQISDIIKSKSEELNDIVRSYLLGVIINGEHIMYCGVEW